MRKKSRGFTLIEAMVVIVIIGIVTAIAIPSMRTFFAGSRLNSYADLIKNSVKSAKNEAMRRSANVIICSVDDVGTTVCGDNSDWANGVIVHFGGSLVATGSGATIIQMETVENGINVSASFSQLSFNSQGIMAAGVTMTVNPNDCVRDSIVISISRLGVVDVNEQTCVS
jgi:type IV fimbrial biogenesis protein FimT